MNSIKLKNHYSDSTDYQKIKFGKEFADKILTHIMSIWDTHKFEKTNTETLGPYYCEECGCGVADMADLYTMDGDTVTIHLLKCDEYKIKDILE